MKKIILSALFITGIAYAGCNSSGNDDPAYRSAADTTSSQVTTPSTDTLIKDTVMKDSTRRMDNPTPAEKTNSDDKNGTTNP